MPRFDDLIIRQSQLIERQSEWTK